MKVLAVNYNRYDQNSISNVIVEMGVDDLKTILGKTYRDSCQEVLPGTEITIAERFNHSTEVEYAINKTPELPQKLRLLADMLDMHIPALLELTAEHGEE